MLEFIKNMIYPWNCCGDTDCHPVPCDQLIEKGNGEYIWNSLIFLKDQVQLSTDGLCHVCVQNIKPLCAFVQMNF